MTPEEIALKMDHYQYQERLNLLEIVRVARSMVATLRDAGREHTAKELESVLFILDAFTQERDAFVRDNALTLLKAMADRLGGRL